MACFQKTGWPKFNYGDSFFDNKRNPNYAVYKISSRPRPCKFDKIKKYYRWDSAFLMGSILTCTDILSFVHKLKRAGTPQKLTSLLEGESLFNYCTCVLIVELIHVKQNWFSIIDKTNNLMGFGSILNYWLLK